MTLSPRVAAPGDKYLKVRPNARVAPPADPRMARAQRWTVWTIRKAEGGRKPSKVPAANPTDKTTWSFFPTARSSLGDPKVAGIGFEMHDHPGVIGVDIDNCIDGAGQRSPTAEGFLAILQAAKTKCHVEISPSGKGLRIFAGETPTPFHDFTNTETGVEVYTGESGRFLAYTGAVLAEFGDVGGPFDPLPQEAVEFLGRHALRMKDGTQAEAAQAAPSEPIPDLSRRDDWKDLYPKALKRLSKEHKEFMESGALGSRYSSASEHLFAVEQTLLRLGLKPAQAYQVLISAEGSWGVALEHREGKSDKAKAFIWDDLQRAVGSKERHEHEKAATDAEWKECGVSVQMTENGARVIYGVNNMALVLQNHSKWKGRIRLNLFKERLELDGATFAEEDTPAVAEALRAILRWDQEPRLDHVYKAVAVAAKAQAYHPVKEMLRGLKWDGTERIKDWLINVGCEDTEVARLVGRPWLMMLVARALRPGCKADNVLILEGPQGKKKSTLFETLAGGREFFTDAFVTHDKDGQMIMHGSWIVELAELASFQVAEQRRNKQFISSPDLTFRPPYGRFTVTLPRHFVLVGTTNDQEYLTDRTGNRRYWPVRVGADKLKLDWLREVRDQLLAEAVAALGEKFEKTGVAAEPYWFDVEPEALEEARDERVESSPLVERVQAFVTQREQDEADASKRQFTIDEVMQFLLLPIGNKRLVIEVADALRDLGLKKRREMVKGARAWRWAKPGWLTLVNGRYTGAAEAERGGAQPLALVKVGQEVGQDEKRSDCS